MKELIAPSAVENAMLILAIAGPTAGLLLGTVLGAIKRPMWPRMVSGLLIGGLGTLIFAMWRVYGAVTDALGLDTVMNLCVQLALFAVLGGVLGLVIFQITQLLRKQSDRR